MVKTTITSLPVNVMIIIAVSISGYREVRVHELLTFTDYYDEATIEAFIEIFRKVLLGILYSYWP